MPLRLKLLIAAIVLVIAGLLASDLVTYASLRSSLLTRIDQQLASSLDPVAHALSEGGAPFGPRGIGPSLVPPGTYGEYRNAAGESGNAVQFTYGGPRQPAPDLPDTVPRPGASETEADVFTTGAVGGGSLHYRVRVEPLSGHQGALVVAMPLTDLDQTLGRLRTIEVLVSVAVVLALGLLLWWLVRRELRPLEAIGETAGAIAAGDLTRRVEPAEDRTEVGRLGLALNAMLTQIEAAFEERRASEERLRRFVADASHELRTPLTSIRGYAELFRRGAGSRPEDLTKSMRAIEAEASRMGLLVEDLLLLARLDQGRPLDREPVDLARIATEAVESARAIEPRRPIAFHVDGTAVVIGDEARLRQVVDNLLDNVRVHTPGETPVEVTVGAQDVDVVLSVVDHGPGLSEKVASRVFERFYRGDPARSRETGGVGLGLSIVAAIVHAHGGSITAGPPGGTGAAFQVRLPAGSVQSSRSLPAQ